MFLAHRTTDVHRKSHQYIRRAHAQNEEMTADAVELEFGKEAAVVLELLYYEITGCCVKSSFSVVDIVGRGKGLEALRRLMNWYEPCAARTKQAHTNAIITNTSATNIEKVDANLARFTSHIKRCAALPGRPWTHSGTMLMETCVKEHR